MVHAFVQRAQLTSARCLVATQTQPGALVQPTASFGGKPANLHLLELEVMRGPEKAAVRMPVTLAWEGQSDDSAA